MRLLFPEFRCRKIETLSREVGEAFSCLYAPEGLPEKVLFWPISEGEGPTDPQVKMFLIASQWGKELESYLINRLGLVKGVDFTRHAMGIRGGSRYFDIDTDAAVAKIMARAEELGTGAASVRSDNERPSSPGRG